MKSDYWVLLDALYDKGRLLLQPHSRYDLEKIEKRVKGGRYQLRAQIAQIRSLPQMRLYWPWVRKVAENSPHFSNEKSLHKTLLVGCGVVEPFIDLHGNIQMMPSSIAFDAMKQDEFDEYFEKAQEIVSTHIIPGIDLKQLMKMAKEECNWKEAA